MSTGRRTLAVVLAVILTVLTAWMSRAPVRFSEPDAALFRLSWRQDGVTLEACRERTPDELEALPVHMRNPLACIGDIASYRLVVSVDGTELLADTVRPAGARGDRPLYILRDLPLVAGSYQASVTFDALLPEGFDPPEGLRSLRWQGPLQLGPGDVALITLDEAGRVLELRGS